MDSICSNGGLDPFCLYCMHFILLFLQFRTLLDMLPVLLEVAKCCSRKGNCSITMHLTQGCSFVNVCSKVVTILKVLLVSLCRLVDSWLPQLAAHTFIKLRQAI